MNRIQFYVTDEEYELIKAHAKAKGRYVHKMAEHALLAFLKRYPIKDEHANKAIKGV